METPASSQQQLDEYLSPELQAYRAAYGDLPASERAALAEKLHTILKACAAYIPHQLVRNQVVDPLPGRVSGTFWQGSLVFADLSGFTALSSQLSTLGKQGAEEVSMVVNQLFNALIDEVLAHQGTLLKFGGDALTAFFDTETLGSLHAAAATHAALAMQQRMEAFSALKTRKGTFRLRLRVGVHSGQVFAAEVGDTSHIELVVTGSEVNRVATAQEIADPGEVVISDQTAALLEHATLKPRKAGFQSILSLPDIALPEPVQDMITLTTSDDMATLDVQASRIAALRPYLVRNLPGRFLDASVFEMGEFRPVSVLFANFHNFSAILESLGDDADRAAAVLNAYFRRAQEVVHRYDGIVNKVDMYTHGDKLMALFGAPNAHEDDPLRAVRCALEMEAALSEANEEIADLLHSTGSRFPEGGEHLHQRIGINTGTVFAGRVGGLRRYEYTVMGSAVNLSARLMSATDDGTVLLSPTTRAPVEHQIAIKELPPIQLKGLPAPVVAAHALHVLDVERTPARSTMQGGIIRAPLVGRESLLTHLANEAKRALQGEGRVLALVGEAGIGKSRIAEELTQQLVMASVMPNSTDAVPNFQLYNNDCQSYEQSIPYITIRTPLRHILGIDTGRGRASSANTSGANFCYDPNFIRSRVAKWAPHMERFTPLLDDVLGIPIPDTSLTEALKDEQRHDRRQRLIVDIILGAATHEPLLISLDDIQWADASSLEVLDRLSQTTTHAALLILLNYRPEPPIDEPWRTLPTTTRVEIHELSQENSADLLTAILNGPPPPEVLPLLERTQGNPFFIEELVRALIASEALARDSTGGWQLTCPLDKVAIPTSIEGLIFARLDRLDEIRHELVQDASVIGRKFMRSILAEVYRHSSILDESLLQLIEAEIIMLEDQAQKLAYLFRHALLRDVAYEGILYARRRELHRRVAQCIENASFGYQDDYLAVVAQHYLYAEEWMIAFYYHKEAGIRAQKRYANHEALDLFGAALEIAPVLQEAMEQNETGSETYTHDLFASFCPFFPLRIQVAELHERQGYIHALLGESEQAIACYLQALEIINHLAGEYEQWNVSSANLDRFQKSLSCSTVRLHRHIATLEEQQTRYDSATDWLERGMEHIITRSRDELARCYLLGARIAYSQGEIEKAKEWASLGSAVAEYLDNQADQAQALLRLGNLRAEEGEFAESIPVLEQACHLFEQLNMISNLNYALSDLGLTYNDVGRWQDAITCYEQSLQISETIGDRMAIARTSNNLALALLGRGDLQRARELYEYSCEQFRQLGSEQGISLTMLNLGEVLLLQGKPLEAMEYFRESMEIIERTNARLDLPEVLRLVAEAMLNLEDYDQATTYALQSRDIANEQSMATEVAMAERVLGQVALKREDFVTASEYLQRSRTSLEQLEKRYEVGKVLFWQAHLAYARSRLDEMRSLLDQAEEIFRELDAQRDLELVNLLKHASVTLS